ncbi:MAG: hypothetical protein M3O32_03665, partial [Actinomycetota bacterium]|nr:hypothetical protein [Actinomycetota bacterium]
VGDPHKVVKAVEHALTSKHPKRRYLCDNLSRVQWQSSPSLRTQSTTLSCPQFPRPRRGRLGEPRATR